MTQKKPIRMNHFFKNTGFTTVELLVTVAIMTAMAAVSIPMMRHYAPIYNTKQATRNIVSQMQFARVHAIKNRVTTVLVFYPQAFTPGGGVGSFMVFEDDNNNWIQDPGESVVVSNTIMPSKVSLISAAFTSNGSGGATDTTSCGYDSQGVAARNGAAYVIGGVQLKNSQNETRTISFNATGKTKISTP